MTTAEPDDRPGAPDSSTLRTVLGIGGALAALVLAVIALIGIARGTPVESVRSLDGAGAPGIHEPAFRRAIESVVPTRLESGNRVEVLINGDGTFSRLLEDLRAARASIAIQVYFWKDGSLSDSVAAVLVERARAGVFVLALFDAFGASLPDEYYDALRGAGVRVAMLRPVSFLDLHKAQQRSHIRAIIIDGAIGYTGGFGFDDLWLGDGRSTDQWRETNARFTGPAVGQLSGAFVSGWAEATGELLVGEPLFHTRATEATADDAPLSTAGIVLTSPTIGSTPAERLIALSVAGARSRLYITNAYFVPDDDFRRLLIEAVGRGVDVRVLAPSAEIDVPVVRLAGHAHYQELLDAGVRIWEYRPTMMHAKAMVVDGAWSLIGTMNFDNRSLALNDEVTLAAFDTALGAEMQRAFLEDLGYADEIDAHTFARRGWFRRLKERGAVMLSRWL